MDHDEWTYDTASDLDKSLEERLKNFPREPDMTMYVLRSLAALVLRLWLKVYHRLHIDGREHLPADGSFIVIANHASHLDALVLVSALPLHKLHRTFPAAAADYFFSSVAGSAFAAIVINALPFNRRIRANQSLALCKGLLANEGNVLVIFPEGTRSLSGELGEFKIGIAHLAGGTEIPIVPCHLEGAARAWPKGAWVPRPRKLTLAIGAPRTYPKPVESKADKRAMAEDLRQAVSDLA
jgi:1-acyl-sn-glycerol-3-phosphate acyltransferase